MKTKRLLLQIVLTGLLVLLPSAVAQADPVLAIISPSQRGTVGTTVNFSGSIGNNGSSAITVDTISANLFGDVFGFTVDTTVFFQNAGFGNFGFMINPGTNTGTITLFSVIIDRNAFTGFAFPGFAFVTDSNGFDSNLANFDVTATPTPEPATMVLLSTGLIGTIAVRRRHRKTELKLE